MKKNVLFTLWIFLFCSVSAQAAITINTVTTLPSTCANNGSMEIFASTSTGTLLYTIISGPVTYPVQTSNIFSSLPPGIYTVEVSNTANETQTTIVTITGNYQLPDFVPSVIDPHCPDSSSGSVIGNLTFGSGLSPYTWELIAPSPVTRPQQVNDTFGNLSSGTYTIRLTDGCNNVQTKTIILFAAQVPMTYIGGFARITGCDSAEIGLGTLTPAYRPPYKLNYTVGGISYTIDTAKLDLESIVNGYTNIYIPLPGTSYGGTVDNITVTNGCGVQVFIPQIRICPFILNAQNFIPISTPNCRDGVLTFFNIGNLSCNINLFPKFPLTVTVRDIPGNNVVEVKTYHSPFDYNFASAAMVPGASYNVTMVDSCNNSNTTLVTTPVVNRYVSLGMNAQQAMLDSTVIATISAVGFPTQGTTLTITGGPVSAHSTKPRYAYSENYVYPKTFTGQLSSDSSTLFSMANAAPGIYTYIITDSCGNQFPGSFEITTNDVASFFYSHQFQRGCVGSSGLQYEVKHNTFTTVTLTDIATGTIVYNLPGWQMNQNPFTSVVNNITAADYEFKLDYYFTSGVANAMNNILIDVFTVRDTVHVTPYQNPALKTTAASSCSGQLFLALLADSTKGIPPYQYEIISGPQTFPPQASNIFQLVLTGNYTIRLIDSCGNSVSTNVTVNPLVFPPLAGLGNYCGSDSAVLTYGASSYFTYTWTKPNGTVYAGDTLVIEPLTTADTGIYTIQRVTTINGCTNTESTTYRLLLNKQDSATASVCTGQTFQFGSRTLTQPGVYRDTFHTSGCDSISILNLLIGNFKKDSSAVSICRGKSFAFGARMLSQPGIYRDTILAGGMGCDSISIVNLTVNELRKDSALVSICRGKSFAFGARMLSQPGIYRDTIPTPTCDSISIVNLTVNELRKDSAVVSICRGKTFAFGARQLSEPGIYRDTIATSTCDSISIINLTVNELRKDSAIVSICRGKTFAFGARQLSEPGIYRDTIVTSTCDSISIVNLAVNELRKDSSVVSICSGQTFTFGTRILSLPGIYRDTVPSPGCDSISVLNLQVGNFKRDSITVSICRGQAYSFGSRVLSQTGIYRDTFPSLGCDSIAIVNLLVNDTPAVQVSANKNFVTAGETIQLSASPNNLSSYLWTSQNGLSANNIYNPTSIVNTPSWYRVTVTDTNNCSSTDSLFIAFRPDSVFTCDGRTIIHIPTAFTPNGDTWNDQFRVLGIDNVAYKLFHLMIYNRWGELIFETNNSTRSWDGRYKGSPANIGNYVYFFRFICADGRTFTRKGNIVLLR